MPRVILAYGSESVFCFLTLEPQNLNLETFAVVHRNTAIYVNP
jgi:hypothetical protein